VSAKNDEYEIYDLAIIVVGEEDEEGNTILDEDGRPKGFVCKHELGLAFRAEG